MYHWASACFLIALQACVLTVQQIQYYYRQWIPTLRQKVRHHTGIRPAAPRCLAIVVADDGIDTRNLLKLRTICSWCGSVGIKRILVYDPAGAVKGAGGLTDVLTSDGGGSNLFGMAITILNQHDALPHLLVAVDVSAKEGSQDKVLSSRDWTFTDPDLMLVFGKAFTLAGFPPWPLRATEMYHLNGLRQVTETLLQQTLQCYSNTTQRFGT